MSITNAYSKRALNQQYQHIDIFDDHKYNTIWYHMKPSERVCFTKELLNDVLNFYTQTTKNIQHTNTQTDFIVLASKSDGIFNLGGDLAHFKQCVVTGNRNALFEYAHNCVRAIYKNHTGLNQNITTMSLIQGDALGGGFEAALASHIIIAERQAKLGFPEILFNLFPGMGAYNLLSRKVGHTLAEEIILSGKLYSAEELHALGIVDVLCESGEGENAVYETIAKENKTRNGRTALRKSQRLINPVTYDELLKTTEIWVDAAMQLPERDLRMMDRLVNKQKRLTKKAA